MSSDLIEVNVKGLMPTAAGCAVFLGNEQKIFVIHMDPNMGLTISMHLQNIHKDRPLTHDLIGIIFVGLGISLEHVIINDVKDSTFFARIILQMKNELGTKIVEIDARPSDAIVLALQAGKSLFISKSVFEKVEDISHLLNKLSETNFDGGNDETLDNGESPDGLDYEEEDPDENK